MTNLTEQANEINYLHFNISSEKSAKYGNDRNKYHNCDHLCSGRPIRSCVCSSQVDLQHNNTCKVLFTLIYFYMRNNALITFVKVTHLNIT